jgi:hypothetical protein
VRQLCVSALREERRPVVFIVGIPEGIVALLRHEDLVVVAVDGGAPRRAVLHWWDWDPALSRHMLGHQKSSGAMYHTLYRARASHSWRYRRPKPLASWPAGCISAVWEKKASVAWREALCIDKDEQTIASGRAFYSRGERWA